MKKEQEISAWARALYLALEESEGEEEKIINNLISLLDGKKYLIPSILKKYETIKEKENTVSVFLAKEVDEEVKQKIESKIENLLGKNKTIEYIVDDELIGGFRIKTKDYLVKASIRDVLTKIKNKAYGYN